MAFSVTGCITYFSIFGCIIKNAKVGSKFCKINHHLVPNCLSFEILPLKSGHTHCTNQVTLMALVGFLALVLEALEGKPPPRNLNLVNLRQAKVAQARIDYKSFPTYRSLACSDACST